LFCFVSCKRDGMRHIRDGRSGADAPTKMQVPSNANTCNQTSEGGRALKTWVSLTGGITIHANAVALEIKETTPIPNDVNTCQSRTHTRIAVSARMTQYKRLASARRYDV
jgi:hypothetical protein